jgi:hypothetical protein
MIPAECMAYTEMFQTLKEIGLAAVFGIVIIMILRMMK